MIDGIGKGAPGRVELGRVGVSRTAPVQKPGGAIAQEGAGALASTVLALAAEGAPVNASRIAEIRNRIAAGEYPVDPDKIAGKMLELDLPVRVAR